MAIDNYFLTYHELVLGRILSGKTKLYPHQREALLSIYQKAVRGEMNAPYRQAALVLCGVGTGKTLIQSIAPYLLAPWMSAEKALFLSDNCTLRSRFLRDFPTDYKGRPLYDRWLLYSLDILPPGVPPPRIVELDAGNFESYAYAMHEAEILVGNRQFVLNLVSRGDLEPNAIGAIAIDEAHFTASASYRTICNYFDRAVLAYFTGSKFRSDSQPLPHVNYAEVAEEDEMGNPIVRYAPVADYEFSLQDAWRLNPPPIKRLTLKEARSEAFLVEEDGIEVSYTPTEFFAKAERDRAWFRQVLFADSFSLPVLQKAVEVLIAKREATGQPHSMIVRALNIPHTHRVAALLSENFSILKGRVGVIHSEHDNYDLAGRPSEILQKYYNGELWVLVHCGMIGVGFDHRWASVSCCLCVLKSMSPAEQEWGRIIRRVPGVVPGQFPVLEQPNWGVVVTHESLGIRSLFEEFLQGKQSDLIAEIPTPTRPSPILSAAYEAGETLLNLSDTSTLKPGDILEFSVPVEPTIPESPKFDLASELGLSQDEIRTNGENNTSNGEVNSALEGLPLANAITSKDEAPLPWQKEVEAISDRLKEIRSIRNLKVQVEAVLDDQRVQIAPAWLDVPQGVAVKRERSQRVLDETQFLSHVGLDWQVLIDGKLIAFSEYKKRSVLQKKGLELNAEGEILANGVQLRSSMPPVAYELFLKGLEAEIDSVDLEAPPAGNVVARPDKAKRELKAKYGGKIKGLIYDLFQQRGLVLDGSSGNSLVKRPVKLLEEAIERVKAKGHQPNFKNNQQLVHAAVFGYIKEATERIWNEHDEQQYNEAYRMARAYLDRLQDQIRWQKRARSKSSQES